MALVAKGLTGLAVPAAARPWYSGRFDPDSIVKRCETHKVECPREG